MRYVLQTTDPYDWNAFSEVCEAVGNKRQAAMLHAVVDFKTTHADESQNITLDYAWIVETHDVHPDAINNLEEFQYAPGQSCITRVVVDNYEEARVVWLAALESVYADRGI